MMRLWNRKAENAAAPPNTVQQPVPLSATYSAKRRLKETHSLEDASSKELSIRSPKPSAKQAKKLDMAAAAAADQNINTTKRFSQLVQNHPFESSTTVNSRERGDKKGTFLG